MGIAVSVLVGIALTLPISSAAICSVLRADGSGGRRGGGGLLRADGRLRRDELPRKPLGRAGQPGPGHVACCRCPTSCSNPRIWIAADRGTGRSPGPIATCLFKLEMNGAPINSGMGTCGLCGPDRRVVGLGLPPARPRVAKGAAAIAPGRHGLDRPDSDLPDPSRRAQRRLLRSAAQNRLDSARAI